MRLVPPIVPLFGVNSALLLGLSILLVPHSCLFPPPVRTYLGNTTLAVSVRALGAVRGWFASSPYMSPTDYLPEFSPLRISYGLNWCGPVFRAQPVFDWSFLPSTVTSYPVLPLFFRVSAFGRPVGEFTVVTFPSALFRSVP